MRAEVHARHRRASSAVHIANNASQEKNCTGTSSRMRRGMLSMSRDQRAEQRSRRALPPFTSSSRPQHANMPASMYNCGRCANRHTSTMPEAPRPDQRGRAGADDARAARLDALRQRRRIREPDAARPADTRASSRTVHSIAPSEHHGADLEGIAHGVGHGIRAVPTLLTPACVSIHGSMLATTAPTPMKKLCIE